MAMPDNKGYGGPKFVEAYKTIVHPQADLTTRRHGICFVQTVLVLTDMPKKYHRGVI